MSNKILIMSLTLVLLAGCSGEDQETLTGDSALYCLRHHYTMTQEAFEEYCEDRQATIIAYKIWHDSDHNDLFSMDDHNLEQEIIANSYSYDFVANTLESGHIRPTSKVELTGIIENGSWTRVTPILKTTKHTILQEGPAYRYFNDARRGKVANKKTAADYLAEVDKELRNYREAARKYYTENSIKHEVLNSAGIMIDSFEFPGNVFFACRTTFPGPVYTCDSNAPAPIIN